LGATLLSATLLSDIPKEESITEGYTMKKLFLIAVLVAVIATLFATSAFAAGPTTPANPAGNGFGPGRGMHTPGTGMEQGAAQGGAQGAGMRRGAPEWAGDNDAVAAILGISVADLQAQRLAGSSLVTIAAKQGIDEQTLITRLLDARKATVSELLAAGKITQAQADYMLNNMAEHVKTMVERTSVGRPTFAGQSPMAGSGRGRWNR
jgi:hypothetical protein